MPSSDALVGVSGRQVVEHTRPDYEPKIAERNKTEKVKSYGNIYGILQRTNRFVFSSKHDLDETEYAFFTNLGAALESVSLQIAEWNIPEAVFCEPFSCLLKKWQQLSLRPALNSRPVLSRL